MELFWLIFFIVLGTIAFILYVKNIFSLIKNPPGDNWILTILRGGGIFFPLLGVLLGLIK